MSIAIVFNGLLRSLNFTYDNLKENILDAITAAGFKYDIYCHTYKLRNQYSNIRTKEVPITLDIDKQINMLKPNYLLWDYQEDIEQTIDFNYFMQQGDPWKESNGQSLKFYILSMWSKQRITRLLESNIKNEGKSYNYVLFIRSDVLFDNKLPIVQISKLIANDSDCIIPDFHHWNGYNDRMFMAKIPLAIKYGNFLDDLYQLAKSHQCHSETCNKLLLIKYNASVHLIKFIFKRVRANGVVCNSDGILCNRKN